MDLFSEVFARSPIVLDIGSSQIKVGFGGEDKPKLLVNSQLGKPKYKALPIASQNDYVIGNQIKEENRGLFKLRNPIDHGYVQNFSDFDLLMRYTFNELKVTIKDYPILITEPPLTPYNQKQQISQLFFENYNAPALFFANQGVLSLFALGKTTGVVLDSGEGVTQAVPVYDGFLINHACGRIDLGGKDVTENLQNLLRRSGYQFVTSAEQEIVKKIKEKKMHDKCICAFEERITDDKKYREPYMLPDNSIIELSYEKQRAPEILFAPDKYGLETLSIPELLAQTIHKVDLDLRRTLYQEIVITGGNTLLPNFPERVIGEIKKLIPKDAKVKMQTPPEKITLCWQGGSILSHLASFKSLWVLKSEFEEEGERVFFRKQL